MILSLKEVEHIAELARLELTDDEKERYREQLSAVLDYAARLQAIDAADLAAAGAGEAGPGEETSSSGASPVRSVLRPDRPRPGLGPEDLLRNAPQAEQNQFRVPPVIE